MKYCMNYYKENKKLSQADEINIKYDKNELYIIDFLKENIGKRINICLTIDDLFDLKSKNNTLLFSIKEKLTDANYSIRFPKYINNPCDDLIQRCKENNIDFFFDEYITDWDKLYGFIKLGVSDIYIVEEMGFSLAKISSIAKENNVKVRVFPNVAQSSFNGTPAITKFFIRPEDIKFYSQYVDIFEFYGYMDKEETYYDIYTSGEWFGDLNEIIINFNSSLDNRCVVDYFANTRANCDKKCLKNRPCNLCERCYDLAKTLHDHAIAIEHD